MVQEMGLKDLPQSARVQVETLIMKPVRMVVIHKPTNTVAQQDISVKDARAFMLACVKSYSEKLSKEHHIGGLEAPLDEFIGIMVDFEDKSITVSEL